MVPNQNRRYTEMTELRDYWRIVRRRWWLPVVLTVLVALVSAFELRPWQSPPSTYSATIRLLLGVAPAAAADRTAYDPYYYAWQTSEYLVDDFTEVVRSSLFAQQVSGRLDSAGLIIPAGAIQGSSDTGRQHRILSLTVNWPNADQLRLIMSAIVAELAENSTFYFQQLGTDTAIVTLLDQPELITIGPSLRQQLSWPLRVFLGFAVGVGLLFLLDYLDTSVRKVDELEAMGFVVLGTIPRQ